VPRGSQFTEPRGTQAPDPRGIGPRGHEILDIIDRHWKHKRLELGAAVFVLHSQFLRATTLHPTRFKPTTGRRAKRSIPCWLFTNTPNRRGWDAPGGRGATGTRSGGPTTSVLPDTLDEHGDDDLDGDEAEHLVFIDGGVRVKTGAPK
jgi:hypothetical protein